MLPLDSGTQTLNNVLLAHQHILLIFQTSDVFAQLLLHSLMPITDAFHAIYLDTGTQLQEPVLPALQDSTLIKPALHVFAHQLHHILALTMSVLLAMPLTIGTQPQEAACHAQLILTMTHQLENANAALKDSLLILQDSDAHVVPNSHIMMLPTKDVFNATFHQFGMKSIIPVSAALQDLLTQMEFAHAQPIHHSLIL